MDKVATVEAKCGNGLSALLVGIDHLLYSVYVVVPVTDYYRLPHTLEHLIFCGSQHFPERGYLDRLATTCQSAGTNAYTSDDHTCYSYVTSSLSGLERLLPVFMDHILNPTLDEAAIQTEVFHVDAEGAGKGVVYCEMQAREWTEGDQMDLALRRALIRNADRSDLRCYGWECGGLTKSICKLDREAIRQYHGKYYHPEGIMVIICGGADMIDRQHEIIASLSSVVCSPSKPFRRKIFLNNSLPLSGFSASKSRQLRYPSDDPSLGSVGISFMGPPFSSRNDMQLIHALHVMMRMLKETSASPLYQRFVERFDPIASDIDYEIKPYRNTMINLIFSGVPTNSFFLQKPMELQKAVMQVVQEWMQKDPEVILQRAQNVLESFEGKLIEQFEDDPHELFVAYTIPELVMNRWSDESWGIPYGSCFQAITQDISALRRQDASFWINLMDTYFVRREKVEVRMVPSVRMSSRIKRMEENSLAGLPRPELLPSPQFTHLPVESFPIEPSMSIGECSNWVDSTFHYIHTPSSETKRLTIAFDLAELPNDLVEYLPLFQELLFQSDLQITEDVRNHFNPPPILANGLVPYQALIGSLSAKFSLFEAAVGYDNSIFACNYFDTHLLLSLQGRVREYDLSEMRAICFTVLAASTLEKSRIMEILENLWSQIKDTWKDPSSVLDSRATSLFMSHLEGSALQGRPRGTLQSVINLSKQSLVISKLRHSIQGESDNVIQDLERLRSFLLQSSTLYNFASGDECKVVPLKSAAKVSPLNYELPVFGCLAGHELNEKAVVEVIPMADVTSSYLSWLCPVNVLPSSSLDSSDPEAVKAYGCLVLLSNLLSYTEGPLYQRLRGAGLAYDAALVLSVWSGLLTLHVGDTTDPTRAILVLAQLLVDVLAEASLIVDGGVTPPFGSILNDGALRAAKASSMFYFVCDRASASNLATTAFRCSLRGLPPVGSLAEKTWCQTILDLSLVDVAHYVREILPILMDWSKCILTLAVPSSKLDAICVDLASSSIPHSVLYYIQTHDVFVDDDVNSDAG